MSECNPELGMHHPPTCKCPDQQTDPVKQLTCPYCYMGVMKLVPRDILAPCLLCSPNENLNDLLAKIDKARCYEDLKKEKRLIKEHNERIK